jgi:YjbE family integral membrane protein
VEFGSPQFWLAGFEIIVINILLSGDNAVVIALACRNLPPAQRRWGVIWGAGGAIVLRIILTFFAISLLDLPWLKIVGGILLLWIGVKLIADDTGEGHEVQASNQLFSAVRTIVIADLVMSLDNVIGVAAAAKGSLFLLVFGLVVSIPLVVAGSQLIMKMIERYPWLVTAGGGLLGYVAGEMMVTDRGVSAWIDAQAHWLHWALPVACIGLVIGVAKFLKARAGKSAGPHVIVSPGDPPQ